MYCNPDVCPHCLYIGEGDSWCDVIREVVLSDWEPTEHYMGNGCPYLGQPRKRKRKHRRKKKGPGPGAGTIVKYAVLTLLGIWLYRMGADYAYQQRGYFAVGGEVFALLLPYFYWAVTRTVKDFIADAKRR